MINKIIETHILSNILVTDQEVEKFYTIRKEELTQPEQVRARHIIIRVDPSDPQKKKDEARRRIERILAEAKAGKEDFGELAKKYSEGPSAPRGGDLGYFGRGQMAPSFEKAAFELNVGELSNIVETPFGYHIIKVEDRKEAWVTPLAEVKEDIQRI